MYQIAQKPQFWGREWAISSQTCQILKCSYYKNYMYCTDHNQILQNNRDPQVLTAGGPNVPQTNPRWRKAAILKNRKILISSQPIDRFWRNLARWCTSTLWTQTSNNNSRFQKSKMAAAAIFKKSKKYNISASDIQYQENLGWWCASILPTSSAYKILWF